VNRLIRLAYGPFQLGTLPIGAVEEVGPRVIREMLADHIRPENLPTGNSVSTPAPIPGRRTSSPIVTGKSGSAMSDPSRKPSRVRAATEAQADAVDRRERPAKKEGWAKATPKFEHTKTFKPRARPQAAEGGEWSDRPRKPFNRSEPQFIDDRRAPRDGAKGGFSDRPKRDFKPRDGAPRSDGDRPQRDFKPREGGFSDRPKRDFKPREGGSSDRPQRDFKPRDGSRPGGGKPFGGKPSGGRGGPRDRG
jgi:23S rRNA pseudouridine2605 synthase